MQIDVSGLDEVKAAVADHPDRVAKAMVRAVNRSMSSARTVLVRACASDLGLRQADVRNAMVLALASPARAETQLKATGALASDTSSTSVDAFKRIPLFKFNAKGPYPSRGKGHGVTARLPTGAQNYPNAFIAVMQSGHTGVFQRSTTKFMRNQKSTWKKKRQAIYELPGPSLAKVFIKHRSEGVAKFDEVFGNNFDHEMAFAGGTTSVATGTD